jgi:hypothetical protein
MLRFAKGGTLGKGGCGKSNHVRAIDNLEICYHRRKYIYWNVF